MILLSIGGMLGTFGLAWFVWYLVAGWKDAESSLLSETYVLGHPTQAEEWANDFVERAADAKGVWKGASAKLKFSKKEEAQAYFTFANISIKSLKEELV